MGALQGPNRARLCREDQLWPGPWLSKSWTVTWALSWKTVYWEMINKIGQVTEAPLERTLLQGLDPGWWQPALSISLTLLLIKNCVAHLVAILPIQTTGSRSPNKQILGIAGEGAMRAGPGGRWPEGAVELADTHRGGWWVLAHE